MSGGEAATTVFDLARGRLRVFHAARRGSWLASKAVGEIIPIAECRRMVLYSSIQAATRALAAALVAKSSRDRSSNSRVEWNDSITALSRAEPGLPMDWRIPSRPQAARKKPAVYSAGSRGRRNTGPCWHECKALGVLWYLGGMLPWRDYVSPA